jgi:hypothetical protein
MKEPLPMFVVYNAQNEEIWRTEKMGAARIVADNEGVGASVAIIGELIYVVTEESLNPDYDKFNE